MYRKTTGWRPTLGGALVLTVALCGCDDRPAQVSSFDNVLELRRARYVEARGDARAWLDRLDVDAVHLVATEIKGIKKLGEVLAAYQALWAHPLDEEERRAVTARVALLAGQTRDAGYHALLLGDDRTFDENSMSYLRVMHLMDRLGLDTASYRERLSEIRPRIDARLGHRQPWEVKAFLRYYEHFGLGRPAADGSWEVLAPRHLPLEAIDVVEAYEVTHEAYVAFDYGLEKQPQGLSEEDLAYLRYVTPTLLRRSINGNRVDLAAEVISSMTYVGLTGHPDYVWGIDYLLDTQNETGSWGHYEHLRPSWGDYVDQRHYLHTTSVTLGALIEAFDGGWPRSGIGFGAESGTD